MAVPVLRSATSFGGREKVIINFTPTANELNTMLQNVPNTDIKIPKNVPLIGGTTIGNPRKILKALLANSPLSPNIEIRFVAIGSCEDPDKIEIKIIDKSTVTGIKTAQFKVFNVGVSITLRPVLFEYRQKVSRCKCKGDKLSSLTGLDMSKFFELIWYLDVTTNPGIVASYEVRDQNVTLSSPCCCDAKSKARVKEANEKRRKKLEKEKQELEEKEKNEQGKGSNDSEKNQNVLLIEGIGEKKAKLLAKAGIVTLDELAEINPKEFNLKGISKKSIEANKAMAQFLLHISPDPQLAEILVNMGFKDAKTLRAKAKGISPNDIEAGIAKTQLPKDYNTAKVFSTINQLVLVD